MRAADNLSVLHIFRYFRPDFTGEGLYFEKIEPLFLAEGLRSTTLVLRTPSPTNERGFREARAGVYYLTKRALGEKWLPLKLLCWMLLNAWRYRVVHFHTHGDRYFLSKLLLRLLGRRIVQSCTLDDSPGDLLQSYDPSYRPMIVALLRLVHVYVVISPRLLQSAVGIVPPDRLRLIPQGVLQQNIVTKSRRDDIRAELGFASEDVLALSVGGIVERKDPMFLVEAMPRLRAAIPRLKLVLVGPTLDKEYAARVVARAQQLGVADRVSFVGYRDDPSPYYAISDIFVFASRLEGFGNVLVEAMAHGLPVVSRLLPGVTDSFITSGKTGFLFGDENEYCAQVERLSGDTDLRDAIAAEARRYVEENLSLAKIAGIYCAIYAELAHHRPVGR